MAKRILLTIVQFCAFLGLLAVGGNWDVINLQHQVRQMQAGIAPSPIMTTIKVPMGSHILIAQGVLFAGILLVLILLFEALRKRLRPWAGLSVLAFALALVVAFVMKLGLPPA